jgi:hypothetical protein
MPIREIIRTTIWVDPDDLICPGCDDTVVCEPPIQLDGVIRPVGEFCHRDGSGLCWTDAGIQVEPIEREVHTASPDTGPSLGRARNATTTKER